MMFPVSCRPDNHFLEAICCFPMVYFMAGTIDKYVFSLSNPTHFINSLNDHVYLSGSVLHFITATRNIT